MSGCVVKPGQAARPVANGARLELRDFAEEARAAIETAKAEGGRIISEARARAAVLLKEAEQSRQAAAEVGRAEGVEFGRAEGAKIGEAQALVEAREQFEKEAVGLAAQIHDLLNEANVWRGRVMAEAERDVLVIALAIAGRIASRVAEVVPDVAVESVTKALAVVREAGEIVIRLNPADVERIERIAPTLRDGGTSRAMRFVADATVFEGGAIVTTQHGTADATLSGQLDRIADELLADWRSRMSDLLQAPSLDRADQSREAKP